MSSILDTPLLNPSLSSLSSLVDPPTDFIGTFGLDSLYPLGTAAPIHPFQSPSSSSSDNDFSSPPTSPESPPPPTSALPQTLKPEVDTTWVGTMDPTLTDVSLMTPLLSGYQLKPVPVNARKRRTTTNRKSVRGGRGRAGRGSSSQAKSILASPPHLPPTPLPNSLPISPSPAKLVKSDSDYPIIATPVEGGVPVEESQLRQLLHDHVLKEKRLKRKAELARLSRKKKQLRMSDLEKQNQALLEENQRLLQQNAMLLAERGKVVYKQETKLIQTAPRQQPTAAPPTATKSKSLESHIHAINDLFTKYGDTPAHQVPLDETQVAQLISGVSESFKQHTGSLESSLKQIEETLVPCTVMQFLEWTLMQREKFYQEENGLFMSLFRDEMKATPTQIAQLLKLRTQMQQQSIKMKDQVLVDAFHAFEKVLLQRGRLQQPDVFEQLRMIFTPRQLATYFRYVSQYGSVLIKVPV